MESTDAAAPPDSSAGVDGTESPMSPMSPGLSRDDSVDMFLEKEAVLGLGRKGLHYMAFLVLSLLALLYASLVAAMFWYIFSVATESITFVLVVQSTFLVLVLAWGVRAAHRANEAGLNLYTFMLLMAVIMQFSIAMVVVARGDEMLLVFQSSAAAAQAKLCADLGIDVSANFTLNENSTVAERAEAAGSELCMCEDGAATCIVAYMQREHGVQPEDFQYAQVAAILLQLLLAKLGWGMIVDLDYEAEQKLKKQAGGPPTGTLRGTIVAGRDLYDTKSKRGRDPKCVVELLTPDTAVKAHRVQSAESQPLVDTLSPEWDEDFDQMVAYAGSRELLISVVDMSKPKKPVSMGKAILSLDGNGNLERGGSEEMTGEDIIEVDIMIAEKVKNAGRGEPKEHAVNAGTVHLRLLYVPVGGSAEKAAKSVTKSWYFEATVLIMVGVSMCILALQSPTDPPSDALQGTLSILEIFVATHMTIELLLELFSDLSNGDLMAELRNPWTILALYVMLCNWATIFQPVELTGRTDGQALAKLVSVSRIFRIIRPIRTLRMIRHIDLVVKILASSMGIFFTVCVLLLFLLLLFSLIGMSCFSGAIQYTCMDTLLARSSITGSEDMVVGTDYPVGCTNQCLLYLPQTLVTKGILRHTEPLQDDGDLISCPVSMLCAQDAESVLPPNTDIVRCMQLGSGECSEIGFNNYTASESELAACESLTTPLLVGSDEFGFQDFDNIVRSVVTMFVQMTGDGMHVMPEALYASGGASSGTAWLIFFLASVLLNMLALNLFLAVCCSAYSDINSEMIELEQREELQHQKRLEALQLSETPEETELREAQQAKDALTTEEIVDTLDWYEKESKIAGCRNMCKTVILSQAFEMVISVVILGNTVVMAFNHQGIDAQTARVLNFVETTFLAIFILEFFSKILGLGRKLYFSQASNIFDFFVVFVCMIGYLAVVFHDEIIETFNISGDGGDGMQALRAVRLLRALQIARLLHKQKALKVVLQTIFSAWKPICVHAIFCAFSVCMFAVIGMHVLGGSLGCSLSLEDSPGGLCPEHEKVALFECHHCRKAVAGDYPYENYETFLRGVLACFELTVGEEWANIMYWYRAHVGGDSGSMTTLISAFFMIQYLWMNCILFSLFIAMLLENFNLQEDEKLPIQKKVWERRKKKAMKHWRQGRGSLLVKTMESEKTKGIAHTNEDSIKDLLLHAAAVADLTDNKNKSLYLFTLTHPFRIGCAGVQGHPIFRNTILVLIFVSCLTLAIEGPDNGPVRQNYGEYFDAISAIVLFAFLVEAALKIVIHGFYYSSGPSKSYLQTKMNRVDFLIIVVCVIGYLPWIGDQLQGGWAKSLRVVRVLTPLVNLTKSPEILLVVMSFLRSIPDTSVIILPLFLMAVVFAVVGQEWFGGSLGECHASCTVVTESRCIAAANIAESVDVSLNIDSAADKLLNLESCVKAGGTWVSEMFNFDNTLGGVSLLFVALADGVHPYMVDSTTALGDDGSILFWIAFHLVFTCFFLNLFIGVLSASFSKSKGTATHTIRQRQWQAVRQSIAAFHPTVTKLEGVRPVATEKCCKVVVPDWWFRWRLLNFNLATNEKLEVFWRSVIMVNTITLATDKFPASQVRNEVVVYLNLACLSFCTLEVIIKLTGYGVKSFFGSGWLVSDFCLVLVSWGLRLGQIRSGVEALRVVRVFRLIALAAKMPTLVALVQSLINCLRASMALIAISCVIIYVYGVVGVNLFGNIDLSLHPDMEFLNDYNNFSTFPSAAAVLVQIVFGQEIGGFVADLADAGAGFWQPFLYFATYYMVIVWVCMNLLLVSVLDTFAAETADTDTEGTRLDDFEGFAHCWAALTIGVHAVPFATKKKSLLETIATKVANPIDSLGRIVNNETDETDDSDRVPEDGASYQQGSLRVTIQSASDLQNDTVRPYCKVQLHGHDRQEVWTPEAATTTDGKAQFEEGVEIPALTPDPVTKAVGYTLSMYINEHHDALTIEVHDNCQFVADFIGAVKLSREELQQSDEPVTKNIILQKRINAKPPSPRASSSGTDHWARFETDTVYKAEVIDELEMVQDESDLGGTLLSPRALSPRAGGSSPRGGGLSPRAGNLSRLENGLNNAVPADMDPTATETLTKEDLRQLKKEQKAWEKQEKKRLKAEKKADKARQKAIKMERKRRKKLGIPEVDAESLSPRNPSDSVVAQQWVDSGVTLQVTFAFERFSLHTPKMGFLDEYEVTYTHKEANCGVEGWLECSFDGGPFVRQFVYIQDKGTTSNGCIKIVTNAMDGNQLEHQGSADKIELKKIKVESIMNIFGAFQYREGEDGQHQGAKNATHVGCEFQIGCDENNEDQKAEKTVGHISGQIVSAEKLINVARGTGETSDPYCVLTFISSGSLAKAYGDDRRVVETQPVKDNLNPAWNHEFSLDAMVTTKTLLVEVYDRRSLRDLLIGTAELQIGSDGPGPVWTSDAIVAEDGSSSVDLGASERTGVKVRLKPEQRSQRDLTTDVDDTDAGTVTLALKYVATTSQDEVTQLVRIATNIEEKYASLKQSKKNDQAKQDELSESKLAVIRQTRIDYRFRALSPQCQMAWVSAVRWLTRGCPEATRPKPLPPAVLAPSELVRSSHNIALLDLPMVRLSRLISGLHHRQVVGGHKPTRRWTTYMIFNIEMHCMAASKKELKRKETKRRNSNGLYLVDIRGLSFHRTLERLAMLNLGKQKCLSYEDQAKEYEKELNTISLHVIKSALQWWVNRRRVGLTQGGKKFPKLPIWSKNQALYLQASDAACVARLRSLRVLFGEVKKRKPEGYDSEGGGDPKAAKPESGRKPGFFEKRRMKKAEAQEEHKRQERLERAKQDGLEVDVKKIEMVFEKLDADDSGELDESEMRKGMAMLMGKMPHRVEEEMMKMVDTDESGTVDLDEFIQGLTTIAMACPDTESDEDEEGDSDLDELDTDAIDLQRNLGNE
eukprot:COSAG02_NODE_8_length_60691_cov_104.994752_40_plen_2944_part_00